MMSQELVLREPGLAAMMGAIESPHFGADYGYPPNPMYGGGMYGEGYQQYADFGDACGRPGSPHARGVIPWGPGWQYHAHPSPPMGHPMAPMPFMPPSPMVSNGGGDPSSMMDAGFGFGYAGFPGAHYPMAPAHGGHYPGHFSGGFPMQPRGPGASGYHGIGHHIAAGGMHPSHPAHPLHAAHQAHAWDMANPGSTAARSFQLDENRDSTVKVEEYSFTLVPPVITVGTAAAIPTTTSQPSTSLKTKQVISNVAQPGFILLSTLQIANVNVIVGSSEDAVNFSFLGQGKRLSYPRLDPQNRATLAGSNTTAVPPGLAIGFSFTFNLQLSGPSTMAGGYGQ